MIDYKPAIREYLNTVKYDIQSQLVAQQRVATNVAVNTIRVVENQFYSLRLVMVGYMYFLQTGVGAKPRSVGQQMIDGLIQWATFKGIQPTEGRTIKQMAFAIAFSLVRRGTAIYRGQQGIDLDQAIETNITPALEGVADAMLLDFDKKLTLK